MMAAPQGNLRFFFYCTISGTLLRNEFPRITVSEERKCFDDVSKEIRSNRRTTSETV